jgi:putative membrane protein
MDTSIAPTKNRGYLILVGVLSVAVPILVAVLLFMPQTGKLGDFDVSFLPHLNAVLNSATFICLIAGFYFIKRKKREEHRVAMLSAFFLSSIFLVSYVIYHYQAAHTLFGDLDHNHVLSDVEKAAAGVSRDIYLILLATHILLAIIVVPFVLLSIYFGITNQIVNHRKVSKFTFPIWTYVALSGVIVYLLISPYYQ